MTENRPYSVWLRWFASVVALAGVLGLSACGGGSGAPNNVFPLKASVGSPDLFSQVPSNLTVTGGSGPYKVTASNPGAVQISVLSLGTVTQGSTYTLLPSNVAVDTPVVLTVQDSAANSVTVNVTVHAAVTPLGVSPAAAVAYSGFPLTLLVTGGTPPYRAISGNPAILPVTLSVPGNIVVLVAGNVLTDTPVNVTILDSAGASVVATVIVRAAPLLNTLTILPNLADCGVTAVICSGQDGTATVTVLGPQAGPIAGRQVRFDVVAGPYGISTAKAGQPIVQSLIVTSDANGSASVIIKANVNAPTQFAQLRVTELASGQQLTGSFLIQQVTDGSKILSVIGSPVKITGAFKGECSAGVPVDYYIYGGTPPYRITASFPDAVILVNTTVNASGGFFEAITNGSCVDPLVFSILDATGRQITALLSNVEGTVVRPPPTPAPALAIAPSAVTATLCNGKTFQFIASGGTPGYGAILTPQPTPAAIVTVAGNMITIIGLPNSAGAYSVTVFDQTNPQKTAIATITCS